MPNITIGVNECIGIDTLEIPLSDGSGHATFGHTEPVVEYNQMNDIVTSFINNVTYNASDYTTSQINTYANQSTSYDKSKPLGVTINTPAGNLIVSDRYSKIITEKSVTKGQNTIYNLIPGSKGSNYAVVSNNKIIQSGYLIPTGKVRMINCDTSNVRDIGGWSCDGGTIKYGKIFRGGVISENDIDLFVNQLGIRHEMDLRGVEEAGGITESALGNGVDYTCTESYTWYTLSNIPDWKTTLECIFDCAINNKPVYVHCTAGADRTGTVICIIEAILGVNQSDLDKDYELTCFNTGASTDAVARRRNESEWSGLITQINNLTVGSTFRDKVINWVATMGFTEDRINEFRKAMIDGEPSDISLSLGTFSITKTLSNVTLNDSTSSVTKYQPYKAKIVVPEGYVIEDVSITMDGNNITRSAFEGTPTTLRCKVINNLINCYSNNNRSTIINGQGYGATIKPTTTGDTLDKAIISVLMGDTDITEYYSNGLIAIPRVTDDLTINIEAESALSNKMVVKESNLNKRISGTDIAGVSYNGIFICDPIRVNITKECPVIFNRRFVSTMGCTIDENGAYDNSKVVLLDSSKTPLAAWYISSVAQNKHWYCPIVDDVCVGDLSTILSLPPAAGTIPSASDVAYVIFSPTINNTQTAITMDDVYGHEIHMLYSV